MIRNNCKNVDNTCGKCGKDVPEDKATFCEGLCNKWFDLQCARLEDEEHESITKLDNKVKWYCALCNKNVQDIMKMKIVKNKDDWPSILNVVFSGIESNSEVTLNLANRLHLMEEKDVETRSTLSLLKDELGYLRDAISKSNALLTILIQKLVLIKL